MRPTLPLALLFVSSVSVSATTYVVNPDGTGDFPTIQAAVDAVITGDVIELTDGTFTGEGNRDISYVGKAITIRSQSGDPALCCIDCEGDYDNPRRGFLFDSGEDADAVLEGVHITGGHVYQAEVTCGGGICCRDGASPTFRHLLIEGNAAPTGGGMCIGWGQPVLIDVRFENNSAYTAAGLYSVGAPTLIRVVFERNAAADCGAIACAGTLDASYCIFDGNSDSFSVGAVMLGHAVARLDNCTFVRNRSTDGPAALKFQYASGVLENCIIAFSTAGEAIRVVAGGEVELACCDIYGNAGGDWVGEIADYSLWSTSPCVGGECGLVGALSIGCWEPQEIDNADSEHPDVGEVILYAGRPNPFVGTSSFRYRIAGGLDGEAGALRVFDHMGRVVKTLALGQMHAGEYVATWDGTDNHGRCVTSGAYLCRLRVGDVFVTRQLLLAK
jgi:hypothetical protein